MKLSKLIKDLNVDEVHGPKSIEITGISGHSKRVSPGNLFIAKKGAVTDGNLYTPEAALAGAAAIVTDIYDPSLKSVTQIICQNIPEIEGILASRYYGFPAKDLLMIGVTGTKGKTTTTYLIQHLLKVPSGLLGTIEYCTGSRSYPASHTTPDALTNQRMLREMLQEGCQAAVMEVSSHALDQKRVSCIDFDISVYTNLFPDHLDYHGTMEDYIKAKNILFASLTDFSKKAVYNADCPKWKEVLKGCPAEMFSYGIENPADLQAKDIELGPDGSRFTLHFLGKTFCCRFSLVGLHNVYNVLAALSTGLAFGEDLAALTRELQTFQQVPGRLERVSNPSGPRIYVDFAHTGEALAAVLKSLMPFKRGKIITVFGCGGDRDPARRASMAKAAGSFSDISIVTSDNPRSEDPQEIMAEILSHFTPEDNVYSEIDRYKAIEKALEMAGFEDLILIAGKGHEKYQIFANKRVEFDDCKVAYDICNKLPAKV